MASLCIGGGRGSTDIRFDKVLSIRDGKVDPLLYCICVGLPLRTKRYSKKYYFN